MYKIILLKKHFILQKPLIRQQNAFGEFAIATLRTDTFAAGMYMLQVRNNAGIFTQKFVVEK